MKVSEILKRGPADKRGLDIKPGDILLSIDRVELTDKVNVSKLLNNKTSESVLLEIASDPKDAKTKRKVEIVAIARDNSRPISSPDRRDAAKLMYDRWVQQNADAVAKASGAVPRMKATSSSEKPSSDSSKKAWRGSGVMFDSLRSGGIGNVVTSGSSLSETEFQIWVNSRNRPARGPWRSSSSEASCSNASSIAAT